LRRGYRGDSDCGHFACKKEKLTGVCEQSEKKMNSMKNFTHQNKGGEEMVKDHVRMRNTSCFVIWRTMMLSADGPPREALLLYLNHRSWGAFFPRVL
jgi:hypothetical protein